MTETRKLAAILVSDVAGYSRLAGVDEDRTLARLRTLRSDLVDPTISQQGRVVKRTGDGSIIEFSSVVHAVRCAVEVQTAMVERNAGVPPEKRIDFRVGIHVGNLVEESDGRGTSALFSWYIAHFDAYNATYVARSRSRHDDVDVDLSHRHFAQRRAQRRDRASNR